MTYYDHEFKQIIGADYADMQIIGENGKTRWMRITPEEITKILEILNKKEEKETK